ncbi:hypothetical protein [Catellatospora paridis]|uniref:hypothetical protein n=1 Tax=Catellatospora paridis TaxID=1617086 RepID=UPI0012D3BEF3|nr:hypothetical protein [Catellatospora paridis]
MNGVEVIAAVAAETPWTRADWIALSSLVVAVVTLAFVIRGEARTLRGLPHVEFFIRAIGETRQNSDKSLVGHIWELANNGTSDARVLQLIPVNCELVFSDDFPVVGSIKAGESVRLFAKPCDQAAAWVLIWWSSPQPHNRNWSHVEWRAPAPGEDLMAALDASSRRRPWLRYLPVSLRRRFRTGPVGPTGALVTSVGTGKDSMRRLQVALSLAAPHLALDADV